MQPPPPNPYGAPQAAPERRPDDGLQYVIPVNVAPLALIAGYAGLASLLCVPGPIALLLGLLALRDLNQNPNRTGKGRAWFGIIAGTIGTAGLIVTLTTRLFQR